MENKLLDQKLSDKKLSDKKLSDRLKWIAITGLFLAVGIFIAIYLLEDEKDNELLAGAFFCSLAGIFDIIRGRFHQK